MPFCLLLANRVIHCRNSSSAVSRDHHSAVVWVLVSCLIFCYGCHTRFTCCHSHRILPSLSSLALHHFQPVDYRQCGAISFPLALSRGIPLFSNLLANQTMRSAIINMILHFLKWFRGGRLTVTLSKHRVPCDHQVAALGRVPHSWLKRCWFQSATQIRRAQ